jgi:MATE family multidrug resistance protein
VLVGHSLVRSGPEFAIRRVHAALIIAWVYSGAWALAYWTNAEVLISLYELSPPVIVDSDTAADAAESLRIAESLLGFVAIYVLLDATQLILAGALRGAGDTWFVLLAGVVVSAVMLSLGVAFEPPWEPKTASVDTALNWWWWTLTIWVIGLAAAMTARYLQGNWKKMRMV